MNLSEIEILDEGEEALKHFPSPQEFTPQRVMAYPADLKERTVIIEKINFETEEEFDEQLNSDLWNFLEMEEV